MMVRSTIRHIYPLIDSLGIIDPHCQAKKHSEGHVFTGFELCAYTVFWRSSW